MSLSAYKAGPEEGARNRQRIEALAKLPENGVCADCPLLGPRWISINLGAFICLPCSGIHRNLGVHVSKVRSVSMDALNDDWVDNMERWGNARVNAEWQAAVPPGLQRPTANDADNQTPVLDRFIRDKYERGLFRKGSQPAAAAAGRPGPQMAGGWGDDDDWGDAPARQATPPQQQPQPQAPGVPEAPRPAPKIESGAYSTGKMQGFGNPAMEQAAPAGPGYLSGALTGIMSAVQSAAPIVQKGLETSRAYVSSYSGNAVAAVQDAVSFDVARDLQHLRVRGEGGADGAGPGAGTDDGAGTFVGFGADDAPPPEAAAPDAKPGWIERIRTRSRGSSAAEPPPSRDISDLLRRGNDEPALGPDDGTDASGDGRAAPTAAAGEEGDGVFSGFGSADREASTGAAQNGWDNGWDKDGAWDTVQRSPTTTAAARSLGGSQVTSRRAPAKPKVQLASDNDDWGQDW